MLHSGTVTFEEEGAGDQESGVCFIEEDGVLKLELPDVYVGRLESCAKELDDRAKGAFKGGVASFVSDDLEESLAQFRAAYEDHPDYRLRYNIAVTLHKLGRLEEALGEFQACKQEAGEGYCCAFAESVEEKIAQIEAALQK